MPLSYIKRLFSRFISSKSLMATSIYMLGIGIDYGLRFIAMRIFTNILSPSEIGEIAIFSSWVAIFSIILNLNLRAGILNARTEFTEEEFKEYISSVITLGLFTSLVGSLIILLLPDFFYETLFGLSRSLVGFALLVSTIEFGIIITTSIWRATNQSTLYSFQSILNNSYSIIISVIFIAASIFLPSVSAVTARIVGTNVVTLAIGLYFIWRRLTLGKVFIQFKYWRYALALSVPLMGHILSTQVLNRADQILIQSIIGEYETGIYSLAYRIGEIPSLMLTAFGSVWAVWFFDRMKNQEYSIIRKRSFHYALGFFGSVFGFMIIGPLLLRIIAPPEYWVGMRLVPVIMVGIYWFILYALLGVAEQYEKKMIYLAVATFIAAVFNVVSNIILLPLYGYEIAAWTTVASYGVMYIFHVFVIVFVLKRSNLFPIGLLTLLGVLLTGIAMTEYILL